MTFTDVLLEHRQLKTSIASENHHAWDLVEVVVEIPCSGKYTEVSTQQQLSSVQTILPVHLDLSQYGPQECIDDFRFSVESDVTLSCQANIFHMCSMCEHIKQPSSDSHIIQSPCSFKVVCRGVRNRRGRAYDNSRGDYYPNISSYSHMPSAKQTRGYLIRCWKRDFPN